MKMIYFFILLFSTSFAQAQSSNNLIPWKANKKLTYNDFKASVDVNSSNAALTSTSIKLDMGYGSHGVNFKISCVFDKSRSWMRVKNEYILQHEQSHFDISELFARMLNKAMKEYKYNESTAGKDMNNIYQRIMTEHQQMQDEYDSESNFSRNKAGQEKWNKKITNALKEYKDYANY